jgi:hypothetical protein
VFTVSGLKVVAMWDNRAGIFALFFQSSSQSAVLFVKISHALLYTEYIVI